VASVSNDGGASWINVAATRALEHNRWRPFVELWVYIAALVVTLTESHQGLNQQDLSASGAKLP